MLVVTEMALSLVTSVQGKSVFRQLRTDVHAWTMSKQIKICSSIFTKDILLAFESNKYSACIDMPATVLQIKYN